MPSAPASAPSGGRKTFERDITALVDKARLAFESQGDGFASRARAHAVQVSRDGSVPLCQRE
jgi:hypothetical protein